MDTLVTRRARFSHAAMHRLILRALWALAVVLAASPSASAQPAPQEQVRVTRDQATIWRMDARIPATMVKAGTLLYVVRRDGDWYIVLVPAESGGSGEAGMIAASQVEPVGGSRSRAPQRPGPAAPGRRPAAPPPPPAFEIFGSGQVALTTWLANDSFKAVTGHSFGPLFGGGVEVHLHDRVFIAGNVEYFGQTGQRVFVSNGDAFRLGIADRVRVIPVSATAGYRKRVRTATAYVGGGAGVYLYKETSDFSDPSENASGTFASYHVLGGVELTRARIVRTAFEVQFTMVPNALGPGGAGAAFNEHNLGGVQFRLKVLVGR
jgi:hypothetical protein